ncbi:MAG: hypothetical protein Q8Q09_25930 [Deltaproteobacteria bacterium]|nr:hypothetical protein [Deltaproteobacteria bacterium]
MRSYTDASPRERQRSLYVRPASNAMATSGHGVAIQRWSYVSSAAKGTWNAVGSLAPRVRNGLGVVGVVGGIALGATFSGLALGAAGTLFLANSAYDAWENRRTTERIPDVDPQFLMDGDGGGFLVAKPRDVELTAVSVTLDTSSVRGQNRSFGLIDTKDDEIHVDRRYGQEMVYKAQDVRVRSVRIGRGRRPTRYDPAQKDHTVAWTLITYSLEALAGRTVRDAIVEVWRCSIELAKIPNQTAACLKALEIILRADPQLINIQLPSERWNNILANFIDAYLTAQQLGIESTYIRIGKKTIAVKLEADAIQTMIQAEQEFAWRGQSSLTTQAIAEAAEGLLDVGFTPSLANNNYAYAVAEWLHALNRAFPLVMANGVVGPAVRAQVLDRPVAPTYRPNVAVDTVGKWLTFLGL